MYQNGSLADLTYDQLTIAAVDVTKMADIMSDWGSDEMTLTINPDSDKPVEAVITPTLLAEVADFITNQLNTRYGCDD